MNIKLPCPKRARLESELSPPRSRCHETALFLNNIGIQLLSQGCYTQAVNTFQDAYSLIIGSKCLHVDLQKIMSRVFDDITHPRREQLTQFVVEVLETRKDGKLLLCDGDCDDILQRVLETVPSSSIAFAIQMREQPVHFLRQQIAIVKHNLAIALYCQGNASFNSSPCLQEALCFSESAALTFLDMRQTNSSDTRLLSLTLAILNSFLHLLQETNKEEKILQCYETLVKCRNVACDEIERLHNYSGYLP